MGSTKMPREDTRSSDFSIDHILHRAGNDLPAKTAQPEVLSLPWLYCTRYCPPKLPRTNRKDGPQRRQLGRHPRIPFSSGQIAVLEEKFRQSPYLSSSEVTQISKALQLADVRVKIWFQNRRARERKERADRCMETSPEQSQTEKVPETATHSDEEPIMGGVATLYDALHSFPPFYAAMAARRAENQSQLKKT